MQPHESICDSDQARHKDIILDFIAGVEQAQDQLSLLVQLFERAERTGLDEHWNAALAHAFSTLNEAQTIRNLVIDGMASNLLSVALSKRFQQTNSEEDINGAISASNYDSGDLGLV